MSNLVALGQVVRSYVYGDPLENMGSSRPHSRSLELTDRSGTNDFPLVIHSSLTMGLSHTVSKEKGFFDRKTHKKVTPVVFPIL